MVKIKTKEKTTISITPQTRNELKQIGTKDEEYEDIIKRTINFTKKFSDERTFHKWVENNFHLLGFDSLIESNYSSFPDLILERDGKRIRVEIETLSSRFIEHKHDPNKVDLVICLIKDKELSIKTIEIEPFEFEQRPSSVIRTNVNLFERQVRWCKKNHFCFSPFLREQLDKEIKRRDG